MRKFKYQLFNKYFLFFFLTISVSDSVFAQKTDTLSVSKSQTQQEKDSLFYTKIKTKFGKNKLLREIYGVVFRDIYNRDASNKEIKVIEENPFAEFEGRVIRKIYVKRLKVFGQSIYDTTRQAKGLDKFLNSLHADTREGIIRKSFLLFDVGDIIDANKLRDNERLLRQSSILHDARILVIPDDKFPNLVDLIVITQDIWSLIPDVGFDGFDKFSIGINQLNFRGLGHSWTNTFNYNGKQKQKLEYTSRYRIPYIGRTFVTGEAELKLQRDRSLYAVRLYRPFLTPEMKLAGGFEISHNRFNNQLALEENGYPRKLNDSTLFSFPLNYNYVDLWLAHSFKLGFIDKDHLQRARLVLSARVSNVTHTERPNIRPDTNQLYRNHRDYLVGIGFSNRRYKRDILIYGFGRTEDVPSGFLGAFVTGYENSELGKRYYSGIKIARGQELRHAGYIYGLLNAGGYSDKTSVVSFESNYFTELMPWGKSQVRHFINLKYAAGNNRYTGEFLDINNENGISNASSDGLRGVKKFTLGWQSVLFSRVNFLGFRIAPFAFADVGWVNFKNKSVFESPVYQGYGLGVRFRNENLTFNTFQVRFAFYPNIPNVDVLNFAFGDATTLRLKDFDISAPEIVPLR